MDRVYTPDAADVLYHYCSAATLQAILASRRIRFTDINMLNDAEETRWGYSVFEEAATRLLKRVNIPEKVPQIDLAFIESVDAYISPIQLIAHPFVACFSTEPDSLGQWRAYGDDGHGFAMGFRATVLARLPVTLLKVEYDREKQVTEMMQALVATHQRRQEGGAPDSEFMEDCCLLATYMVAFKHPAFAYENEIRCVHVVNVEVAGERLSFVDPGGLADGVDVGGETIGFQVRDNHLTAFLDIPLQEPHAQNFIGENSARPEELQQLGKHSAVFRCLRLAEGQAAAVGRAVSVASSLVSGDREQPVAPMEARGSALCRFEHARAYKSSSCGCRTPKYCHV